MRAEVLAGLLAEPVRLRAFAAVVLGAATPSEVVTRTGLPNREVVAALRRLEQGGLVSAVDGRLAARVEVFKELVREYAQREDRSLRGPQSQASHVAAAAPQEPLDDAGRVLRTFVVNGRLTGIPVARGKRRIVLEQVAASFEPGVKYPERAVNAILRAWFSDHASLRRYLVDEELLARENGVYWRVGGPVDLG